MDESVFWLLELDVKPGERAALETLMNEMVASTRDEPGARNYEWFITDDDAACHIYERYADSGAVMAHLGNFGAHFAERFFGLLTPSRFQVYGTPSDEVREALGGIGATFMGPFGGFKR